MNAVQKFNALDGKKVTKIELEKLKDFATNQLQQHVVDKLNELLLNYPFMLFKDKGIKIEIKEKVKWIPTGTGLGAKYKEKESGLAAARHTGLAKEGLNDCGRLKPGFHYVKGGGIAKSKPKIKDTAASPKNPKTKGVSRKKRMTNIVIHWAEGKTSYVSRFPKTYTSWSAANNDVIPLLEDRKGYNKVKFTVTFEGKNNEWQGRLDINQEVDNPTIGNNVFGRHIYNYLVWASSDKGKSSFGEKEQSQFREWLQEFDFGSLTSVAKKKDALLDPNYPTPLLNAKKPVASLTDAEIKAVIKEFASDILWTDPINEYMDEVKIEFDKRKSKNKDTGVKKIVTKIESKPSRSGKRKVWFPTINGKRIDRTNFSRKWEAQKVLKTFLEIHTEEEILKKLNSSSAKKKDNQINVGGLSAADLNGLDEVLATNEEMGLGKPVSPDEIYQRITDRIAELLKEDIDWEKEWNPDKGGYLYPYNFDSKKRYRGINSIMLGSLYMFNPSYSLLENPYYLTIKQVEKYKGKIKKGTAAHQAIYFTKLYKYEQAEPKLEFSTYDPKKMVAWLKKNRSKISLMNSISPEQITFQSSIPILKYYNVFNGADIEGIDFDLDNFKLRGKIEKGKTQQHQKLEIPEAIIKNYPKPSPNFKFGGDRAFFRESTDLVQMPNIEQFEYVQAYYTTFFHELIHSTGSKKRLDREKGRKFGDKKYAFEELIAELGASFLSAESGILHYTLRNSAAYIKSWRKNLLEMVKEDNRFFFRAASKAQAASDYMLQLDKNGEPKYRNAVTKKTINVSKKTKNVPKKTKSVTLKPKSAKKAAEVGTQLGLFGTSKNKQTTAFNKAIIKAKRTGIKSNTTLLLGNTLGELSKHIKGKLFISGATLKKAMGKDVDHDMGWHSFINLPDNLNSPIAIFKSKTKGLVILTQVLDHRKKPIMAAIRLSEAKNGVAIVSMYSRTRLAMYGKWMDEGLLLYGDKKSGLFKQIAATIATKKKNPQSKTTKNKPKPKKGMAAAIVLDNGIAPLPPKPAGVSGDSSAMALDSAAQTKTILDPVTPKPKVTANNPLKMDGLVTGDELNGMHFETLDLTGKWVGLMQEPAKKLRIAVYGKPKNGKTGASVDFASELVKHGTVLYNFADQGINKSTKDLWNLFGLNQNPNAVLYGGRDLNKLESYVASGKFDYVFVDLINAYIDNDNLKAAQFESRFLHKYPEVGFIMVMESTKSGDFKGEQKWMHLPDQILEAEDFVLNSRGRYGAGEVVSWKEGLQKVNPKRYEELVNSKEGAEEASPILEEEMIILQ